MGFFESFWVWLGVQLDAYIGHYTGVVARALEPAAVTFGTIYVMIWGYLQMTGKIEEPFTEGLKRIITFGVIIGVGIHLWLYHEILRDFFYAAPTNLAARIANVNNTVTMIDDIWTRGSSVAETLAKKGGIWGTDDITYTVVAFAIWIMMGLLCVYVLFLLSLSKVAVAVLLAVGPLFILMLLFQATHEYFNHWIRQLSSYALITVIATLVAMLFLQAVEKFAADTQALGENVVLFDAFNMVLLCVLAYLLMRQVPPIAGGLAGSVSLNTYETMGRTVRKSTRMALGAVAYGRGLLTKHDPRPFIDDWSSRRKAGYRGRLALQKLKRKNRIEEGARRT